MDNSKQPKKKQEGFSTSFQQSFPHTMIKTMAFTAYLEYNTIYTY
jgi:hypothetical protein